LVFPFLFSNDFGVTVIRHQNTDAMGLASAHLKANFHSGKLSVDWNGQENFSLCLKSFVPPQSSQDKEKFSCPFQSTDNFPEWKLALRGIRLMDVQKIPGD
jgi:hypothetical protein